ncbi:hypothetical protein H696_05278 [Fonticula alba]|uniref:Coronin n=1 Tax=Fonticula alba TaxID=691883 RepID=A0A058Z4B4_FONAL|nr:hypothetical protein H696_05278 [Fonticula alba]KCV68362.1 hypothetical protein H696_05278 [Fonticula alba]|eukprot:XP_009497416.1 hypothetical protein H696_05278 [Fonticula alba]
MSRFVRNSKFRHVFGTAAKKDLCFDGVRPSRTAHDTNLIKANSQYLGVCWEAGGGGAFAVFDQTKDVGKVSPTPPLFTGHKAAVLDLDFHPFNDYLIASASEDCTVKIWQIPEELKESQDTPLSTLAGHKRRVGAVLFHPTADNTLATVGGDLVIKLWDIEAGVAKVDIEAHHTDLINSIDFNYNGNLMVTSCRDKQLRIFDVRSGKLVQQTESHQGVKGSRCLWLGDSNKIATTGFSRASDRQMAIRDVNDLDNPIYSDNLDTSAGMLMPFYDEDCHILYLAGKGDTTIRYFEVTDEKPHIHHISNYSGSDPSRGVAFVPKRAVNVNEVEIGRAYRLTTSFIEPISFKVPRKSELFQDDLFPEATSGEAPMSCAEFFGGKSVDGPKKISLENGFVPGARKDVSFKSVLTEEVKDDTPKNEKEYREAWAKLKAEVTDLQNKLTQKDIQIRVLEQKITTLEGGN